MRRTLLLAIFAAALVATTAPPGGAAIPVTQITGLAASASGSSVSVTGSAVFGGESPVTVGTDPAGDNVGGAGSAAFGLDLTEFQISQPDPNKQELLFTIKLASLVQNGIPETILYDWDIMVDGGEAAGGGNWSIKTMRSRASATQNANPYAGVFTCVPSGTGFTCTEVKRIAVTYDTTTATISMTVPMTAIAANPGSLITAWPRSTNPIWIGPSASGAQTLTNVFDTASHDDYLAPTRSVQVGLAPAGTPADQVAYSTATLAGDGSFSGTLTVPGPGSYDVYARACFGGNCATATAPVTV